MVDFDKKEEKIIEKIAETIENMNSKNGLQRKKLFMKLNVCCMK